MAKRLQFSCCLSTVRDIVAQVCKCGSTGLDWFFPVIYLSNILLLYEHGRVRVVFFFFFGFVQQETSMWYQIIRTVRVVFWGTLLRPTAGAVVLIRKCTTLQNVPWLCTSIQEESCAISLWSSPAISAVNIA